MQVTILFRWFCSLPFVALVFLSAGLHAAQTEEALLEQINQLPEAERQATISRPKYFIRCTAPTVISVHHATWNQPVGSMDRGSLAMESLQKH